MSDSRSCEIRFRFVCSRCPTRSLETKVEGLDSRRHASSEGRKPRARLGCVGGQDRASPWTPIVWHEPSFAPAGLRFSSMVHLVATLANDADHMPSLLHALRNEVVLPEKSAPGEVWGVGYYAEDRALIIRKPAELLTSRSVFELAPKIQSSIVLACVKRDVKALEQAPPHRFRNWLFGYCGDLSSLTPVKNRVVDKMPDFVLPEIGDSSGGSLTFGMFITELHRAGLLADPLATHATLAQAMQRTVDAVRMLATEAGVETPQASFVATNGRVVIASRA